ncbi:hypothetical protein [Actinophytocola sp.]|uniref:DUF7144 family membrane protein n=1 Tax=Actinophytocola sp. TaxID=1872138 RepID=UPI00389A6AE3
MSEAQAGGAVPAGTSTTSSRPYSRDMATTRSTGWAGWMWFAAIMLVMAGVFNAMYGLVALFQDTYYVVGPQGLLVFDLTRWGWILLVTGTLAVVAGMALFTGALWARIIAVVLAAVNALIQMGFMPAYPVWALVAIAVDIIVIWAVIVHGGDMREESWR